MPGPAKACAGKRGIDTDNDGAACGSGASGTEGQKFAFEEGLLVTHRGLSGPLILQIASYRTLGRAIRVDLCPGQDLAVKAEAVRPAPVGRLLWHGAIVHGEAAMPSILEPPTRQSGSPPLDGGLVPWHQGPDRRRVWCRRPGLDRLEYSPA